MDSPWTPKDKITVGISFAALIVSAFALWETAWNVHDQARKSAYYKFKAAVAVFKPALQEADSSQQILNNATLSKEERETWTKQREDGDKRMADVWKDLAYALAEVATTFQDDKTTALLAQVAFNEMAGPALKAYLGSGHAQRNLYDPVSDFVYQMEAITDRLEARLEMPKGNKFPDGIAPSVDRFLNDLPKSHRENCIKYHLPPDCRLGFIMAGDAGAQPLIPSNYDGPMPVFPNRDGGVDSSTR